MASRTKYGLRKRSRADAELTEEERISRKRGRKEFVVPELVNLSS